MSLITNSFLIIKPQVGGRAGFNEKVVTEKTRGFCCADNVCVAARTSIVARQNLLTIDTVIIHLSFQKLTFDSTGTLRWANHNKQKPTEDDGVFNCPRSLSQLRHNGVPHLQVVQTVQNPKQ